MVANWLADPESSPMENRMTQIYARIIATGSALPERIVTNADLEKIVDTSDEWIRTRTGIRQRHIAADGETTGDLAFRAAQSALEAAGVKASELDLIVLGTTTPDIIFPSTACLVQHRLGANGCAAFDVNAACSGFVYALGVADKFIRSGQSKKVLVIGAETLTRMVDWSERETCVLFGDGAGAVVLEASSEPGMPPACTPMAVTRSCCTTRWACRSVSRTNPTTACAFAWPGGRCSRSRSRRSIRWSAKPWWQPACRSPTSTG